MQQLEANFLKTSLYAIFLYLGIDYEIAFVLFVMMTIDSGLGIIKALRLGEKFSFKVLAWGMVGKLAVLLIPLLVALIGKGLSFDFKYFVIGVMDIMIVSEGISCFTNIISIKTKKQIENTDYVTMLLNTIRKSLMNLIQKLFSGIELAKAESINATKKDL